MRDSPNVQKAASNVAISLFTAAAGFGATVYVARIIGPTAYGQVAILLFIFSIASVFDILRPAIIFRASHDPGTSSAIRRVGHMLGNRLALAYGTVAFGAVATTIDDPGRIFVGLAVVVSVVFYFRSCIESAILEAGQSAVTANVARCLGWLVTYLGFAYCAHTGLPIFAYSTALAIGVGIALFGMRVAIRKMYSASAEVPNSISSAELWAKAVETLRFNFAGMISSSCDRVALLTIDPNAGFGRYAALNELATKPTVLLRAIVGVWYPDIARRRQSGNPYKGYWLAGFRMLFAAVFMTCSVICIFRAELIRLLLGDAYVVGADALAILAIAFLFSTLGYLAIALRNAHGDFSMQRHWYARAALATLLLAGPLVWLYGITGAASTYLVARSGDVAVFFLTSAEFLEEATHRRLRVSLSIALGCFCALFILSPLQGLLLSCLATALFLRQTDIRKY